MLEIKNIYKSYSGKEVLKDCSFSIKKGQICGLFGVNGAGKSTLIKIIADLEKANDGQLFFDGKPFKSGVYPKIGAMIERPAFFGTMSGYQNLRLLADLSGDCTKEDILNALEKVGLTKDKDEWVKFYSLGMQQRLYFASAIMRNVDILLLDEPFNGIDPIGLYQLENMILKLANEGKTILISSHIIKELQGLISHAVFINDGKIIFDSEDLDGVDVYKLFIKKTAAQIFESEDEN